MCLLAHLYHLLYFFNSPKIGDCYVAVTGVPTYSKDHCLIMARFAHDIVVQMDAETLKLQSSLGAEVRDLALRVGIHSGPVTAGVLRGDRARFQVCWLARWSL